MEKPQILTASQLVLPQKSSTPHSGSFFAFLAAEPSASPFSASAGLFSIIHLSEKYPSQPLIHAGYLGLNLVLNG